jgi:hypothetical protein
MTLQELITDLKAAGANDNTLHLALNCYELGKADAQRKPLSEDAIQCLAKFVAVDDFVYDFARAIEKAHGIKGSA